MLFIKENISFTKLGEEEFEVCETHKQHVCKYECESTVNEAASGQSTDCGVCKKHEEHLEVKISREFSGQNREKNSDPENHYFSMDMEKIIMLPHLPLIKTALFTRRIILINQTIAPLCGKKCGGSNPGKER